MAAKKNDSFDLGNVLIRIAFSLALVFLTFNPTGHSYYHWLTQNLRPVQPQVVLAGLVLLGGWLLFVRSTLSSMGTVGVVLLIGIFASIIWWMVSAGWLSPENRSQMAWVVLTCLGVVLGVGMSWAHLRAKWSGQASVDRVDQGH
jgi:hypothetical protein